MDAAAGFSLICGNKPRPPRLHPPNNFNPKFPFVIMPASLHASSLPAERSTATTNRRRLERDILWGQPVFKAPELPMPNPRVIFDPLPFTAVRATRPAVKAAGR